LKVLKVAKRISCCIIETPYVPLKRTTHGQERARI
jgi:hypothetical protein